jgi:hypothetical protein
VILLISILLGLESIIMLSISGVFFLNAFWELRERGLFGKGKAEPAKPPSASEDS